ncbi:hypothetical protein CSOJ01_01674 [Colletotrichum sojae]|uniref:Uncharacterized protein n=1 Tax=Colletotrichum sojae TaxID=2175907 RepID=A0A8H6JTU5_9PEZI|nr:hypothetical protein CSOJ01_01674 [Colletotrichum sojae]
MGGVPRRMGWDGMGWDGTGQDWGWMDGSKGTEVCGGRLGLPHLFAFSRSIWLPLEGWVAEPASLLGSTRKSQKPTEPASTSPRSLVDVGRDLQCARRRRRRRRRRTSRDYNDTPERRGRLGERERVGESVRTERGKNERERDTHTQDTPGERKRHSKSQYSASASAPTSKQQHRQQHRQQHQSQPAQLHKGQPSASAAAGQRHRS